MKKSPDNSQTRFRNDDGRRWERERDTHTETHSEWEREREKRLGGEVQRRKSHFQLHKTPTGWIDAGCSEDETRRDETMEGERERGRKKEKKEEREREKVVNCSVDLWNRGKKKWTLSFSV